MSNASSNRLLHVGLIGARGHTGTELVRLLQGHPGLSLDMAASHSAAGERISDHIDDIDSSLVFSEPSPSLVADIELDIVILALPNGASQPFVDAANKADANPVLIDLSADHRFDKEWAYGLPEHFRGAIAGAKRIANPGCYATAMQLALRPMLDLLAAPPAVFGVSGYSGAGTTPSDRNDPEKLRDNLMPYALTDHVHEREVTHHLGQAVRFHPHVAPFFRGITLTVSMPLNRTCEVDELDQRFMVAYLNEPLVRYTTDTPYVRDVARQPMCSIGGLTLAEDGQHAVVVATIDNLLKGAATQAIQNINLAVGLDELSGIEVARETARRNSRN